MWNFQLCTGDHRSAAPDFIYCGRNRYFVDSDSMADMNMDQTSGQDNDNQENTDLLLFDPDFQEAEPQKLITNLPKLNECEFDHNYILHHLEQLEIDPTLCSKCSTANKYLASPEPFVQDLYKNPATGNELRMSVVIWKLLHTPL